MKKQLLIERQEDQPNEWLGNNASEWLEGDADGIEYTDSDACSTSSTPDSGYSYGDRHNDDELFDAEFTAPRIDAHRRMYIEQHPHSVRVAVP
ncbi:hypothetical protein RI367_005234 [Sorochytrium milnesiophthora]